MAGYDSVVAHMKTQQLSLHAQDTHKIITSNTGINEGGTYVVLSLIQELLVTDSCRGQESRISSGMNKWALFHFSGAHGFGQK